MREFLEGHFDTSPDISTISKPLGNLNITNKTIVGIPADRNTPCLPRREEDGLDSYIMDEAGSICIPQEGLVGQWLATPEVEVPSNRQRDVSLLAALVSGRTMESYVIRMDP